MRRSLPPISIVLLLGWAWLAPRDATAQFAPPGSGGPGGLGPGAAQQGPQKEEGPAERAPETAGQESALAPLPSWPGTRERALQFFQLNGYIRARTYLFHNANLGVPLRTTGGSPIPPFWVPFSETNATGQQAAPGNPASCAARRSRDCRSRVFTSTDMRLRLEPTINVSEDVRVMAQFDIFDNYVLGSTPQGYFINGLPRPPETYNTGFFATRTSVPGQGGINAFTDAIVVKRAWAEVRTPIGLLSFGRMPSHFGMGVGVNNGNCLDCDYGVNVDRVSFTVREPWAGHYFTFLWDWAASGPTTQLYTPSLQQGPFYNADRIDDVGQWGLVVSKVDKPEDRNERIEKGQAVINYGAYFTVRRQSWDLRANPGQGTGGVVGSGAGPGDLSSLLVPRNAWAFIPDLWFRLDWRKLRVEAEWVITGGRVNSVADLTGTTSPRGYTLLQYGGVLRVNTLLLRKALNLGVEIGYASGDSYEDPNAAVNFRLARIVPPDGATISNFRFDPDYHVDMLLFRRIIGTVSNATYFKPNVSYNITESIFARADVIYSLANRPVAYPGNSVNLGLELDATIMYHNEREGFYFGVSYGVLFPFSALDIRGDIFGQQFLQNATTAQAVQARVVVKF